MDMNQIIGIRIKELRSEKHLTLKELSHLSGISISLLSLLERGKISIVIETLSKIAKCLDVDISYFFSDTAKEQPTVVVRSYDAVSRSKHPDCMETILTPHKENASIFPVILTFRPNSSAKHPLASHFGEEFLYVIDGVLTLQIGDAVELLYPRDSAHYKSSVPHAYWNASPHTVHVFSAHLNDPQKILTQEEAEV